jgi:glycosyltransferase involved in cell wall biosynthesis
MDRRGILPGYSQPTVRPAAPLRIAFLCQNDFGAPTEKQALGYAEQLLERGHDVLILIGREASTIQSEGADRVPRLQLRHYRFRGPRLRRGDVDVVRAFRPSLIHAFNPRVLTISAAAQLQRATSAPVFVHFEDDEWNPPPNAFPGERFYLPYARWVRRHAWRLQPSLWWQATPWSLRWVQRNGRAFDALTPVLADEVRKRLGRDCSVVLPITPRRIGSGEAGADGSWLPDLSGTVVGLTGTILPVYLPDLLQGLDAIAEVQRRGHDVSFLHAGDTFGFDPQVLAAQAGIKPGTAHFLGYRPFREVAAVLERSDILIQPGPPSEFNRLRLPSKMQTYLESGKPTITFAVGFGELLEDGIDVLKTHSDDPHELADRIVALIEDPELARRVGRGGRAAAARLFDPATNTDALEQHYFEHLGA